MPILSFFRPAGATGCTYGATFGRKEGAKGLLLPAKFHPHQCNDKGIGPQKLKFLLRFDKNVEYKRPTGAYPSRDFHKISRVYTPFQDALAFKTSLDLLKVFEVLYHHAKFGGAWISPAAGVAKNVELSVCLSVCLSVRHACESQRFRQEDVGVQKRF